MLCMDLGNINILLEGVQILEWCGKKVTKMLQVFYWKSKACFQILREG